MAAQELAAGKQPAPPQRPARRSRACRGARSLAPAAQLDSGGGGGDGAGPRAGCQGEVEGSSESAEITLAEAVDERSAQDENVRDEEPCTGAQPEGEDAVIFERALQEVRDRMDNVRRAAHRGDWRAAVELLEIEPVTLEHHRVEGGWQGEVTIWGGAQSVAGRVRADFLKAGDSAFLETFRYLLKCWSEFRAQQVKTSLD